MHEHLEISFVWLVRSTEIEMEKRGKKTLVLAGSSFVLQMRRTYDFNKVTTHIT